MTTENNSNEVPIHLAMFEAYEHVNEVVTCLEAARIGLRAQGITTVGEVIGPELLDLYKELGGDPSMPI